MALKEITVPDIGDFDEVEVIELLVSAGDEIKPEQGLIVLESDKASMDVPAPFGGVVKEMKVKVGDHVSKGTLIATVEADESAAQEPAKEKPRKEDRRAEESEEKPAAKAEEKPAARPAEGPPPAPEASDEAVVEDDGGKMPHASPSVRRFARELGVNLAEVPGTGRKGRILKDDVQNFVKHALQVAGQRPGSYWKTPPIPEIDFSQFGEIETRPLTKIQKVSGKNLHRSWLNIPHVTQFDVADITELEAFRKKMRSEHEGEVKITILTFFMKAVAAALKEFPKFNSSLDPSGESLILKKYFHIGVAVDTPNGLVVPVIRDVNHKGILDLARELADVSERARARRLAPDDVQGASMSISSLGGLGGTAFTPIINPPEVCVLGVSKAEMKPVWNGKEFEPRLLVPLSLSYDHRVIDGAGAVRFTTRLAQLLTDVREMLL